MLDWIQKIAFRVSIMGYDARGFRFDCPQCGEPWAITKELVVDVHGGSTYTCADCGGKVMFKVVRVECNGSL